jgi:hypothetical protein
MNLQVGERIYYGAERTKSMNEWMGKVEEVGQ